METVSDWWFPQKHSFIEETAELTVSAIEPTFPFQELAPINSKMNIEFEIVKEA
jgi:hypothetical protein